MKKHISILSMIFLFAFSFVQAQTSFIVTNNNDSGTGSLKQAILDANTTSGADTIKFNIPSSSEEERTIVLSNQLPYIMESVVIDGTTQSLGDGFYNSNAKIAISGSKTINYGIYIKGSNTKVFGLNIIDFNKNTVYIDNASNCVIGEENKENVFVSYLQNTVHITGASAKYNKISRNVYLGSRFHGIVLASSANESKSEPIICSISSDGIKGFSNPNDVIEVYVDTSITDKNYLYVGQAIASGDGSWEFNGNSIEGEYYAIAIDVMGNTSSFGWISYAPINSLNDLTICNGQKAKIEVSTGSQNNYEYLWSTGAKTKSIEVSTSVDEEYSLIITDTNTQCSYYDTVNVSVKSQALKSGILTVGPNADYNSITNALNDIVCGISGSVIIELQKDYTSDNESLPIVIREVEGASAENTITIRPAIDALGLEISPYNFKFSADAFILFDGADYFIIDGRPGGVGENIELTINEEYNEDPNGSNKSLIQFFNKSCNNEIKYCNISFFEYGGVYLGNLNDTLGSRNNNIAISNCKFFPSSSSETYAYKSIYSYNSLNSDITILNNEFINCGEGIYFTQPKEYNSQSVGLKIIGNHFYMNEYKDLEYSFTPAPISLYDCYSDYLIKDNYIGGSEPFCKGDYYNCEGIYLAYITNCKGVFENNRVSNISSSNYVNFQLYNGKCDIINNYFGDTLNSQSIVSSNTNALINASSNEAYENKFCNNVVSGFSSTSMFSVLSTYGFFKDVLDNKFYNIENNSSLYVVYASGSDNNVLEIERNHIKGVQSNAVTAVYAGNNVSSISNNIIENIVLTDYLSDIISATASNSITIDGNIIKNIQSVNPNAGGVLAVMRLDKADVKNNIIYNVGANSKLATVYGAFQFFGTSYENNIISLGLDSEGNPIENAAKTYGIFNFGDSLCRVVNNSISIYGNEASDFDSESFALYIAGESNLYLRNNILSNFRKQYAPNSNNSILGYDNGIGDYDSDYNQFYLHENQSAIVYDDTVKYACLQEWQDSTKQDQNSVFSNPSFISNSDLHIQQGKGVLGDASTSTVNDIDGDTRQYYSIGADDVEIAETGMENEEVCDGVPVYLFAGNGLDYEWSTGDTTNSILVVPSKSETYYLTVTNSQGCAEHDSAVITLTNKAQFDVVVDTINKTVDFIGKSSGDVDKYYWTFGDNQSSNELNPTHVYDDKGVYDVCLNVMDSQSGCQSKTCIEIEIDSTGCKADFVANYNEISGNVEFTDSSRGNINNWQWIFGDGSVSYEQNPEYKFDNNNIYFVKLIVSNSDDCIDSYNAIVYASDITTDCESNFVCNLDLSSNTIEFQNTSIGKYTNSLWQFGDGDSSKLVNPSHQYSGKGFYEVCLTVSNETNSDIVCKTVNINVDESECYADFVYSVDQINNSVTLKDVSFGNISKWEWDFGDGNISEEENPTHVYSNANSYLVSLKVSGDISGCIDFTNEYVNLNTEVDSFKIGYGVQIDTLIKLKSTGTLVEIEFASSFDMSDVLWTWGDGTTTSGQMSPSHKYADYGTYEVCVYASSDDHKLNETAKECKTIILSSDGVIINVENIYDNSMAIETFPNPSNDVVNIRYKLEESTHVEISIYNLHGELVDVIVNDSQNIGEYNYTWNCSNVSAGIYTLKCIQNDKYSVQRVVVY